MFRSIILALFAVLAVTALPSAANADVPSGARQWEARNASTLQTGTEYDLFNGQGGQLGYGNRTFGVDLEWTKSGGRFVFMRDSGKPNVRDHRRGPIAEDQRVAIYNTKTRRYLRYENRGDVKADLEWSRTPVYEWNVQGQQGNDFALFNTRVSKYVAYKFRNYGINLGWLQVGPTPTQSFSVSMSAQPVIEGWIPYLGSFGAKGTLLSAQNASQSATLMFLKPGKKTGDCSDPTATERVAPGAKMTAAQMKTLYGAETPRLPLNFLACITTPTPQNITLTFLNITYRLDA
ncbi:MAG: hypothetical protein JHC95_10710 [Solirubrobacteraceae bacterium]|nr:hypothetical protein [Solirubrobacteraceae bacterium]